MKKLVGFFLGLALLAGCQKSEVVSEFTGNQSVYTLQPGSQYPISGTITFKERKDGAVTVAVKLTGTSSGTTSPVHLHLGDITSTNPNIAALLNPVNGQTGVSETRVDKMADETAATYARFVQLNACVKIHLTEVGPESDIILAAGNVGTSFSKTVAGGRFGVAACKPYTWNGIPVHE